LVLSAQHLSNRAEAKRKGLVHLSASIDWRRVQDSWITKLRLRSWIGARRTIEDVNRQINLSGGGRDRNAGGT
jgi:hypothetical protein